MHEYDSTLEAALYYASLGWKLFPVHGASNPSMAKHPVLKEVPHWHQDSTDDPKQLIAWFTGTSYGIGLDCGKSGVFVLDGDRLDAVPANLNLEHAWSMQGNPERKSWVYQQPEDISVGCSPGQWEAGEVKGDGGYVVLPPSFHPVGGTYTWIDRSGSMRPSEEVLKMLTVDSPHPSTAPMLFATAGKPCKVLSRVLERQLSLIEEAGRAGTGRFLAMSNAAYAVAACGAEGHQGAAEGLKAVREAFYRTHDETGSEGASRAEWARSIRGLAVKLSDRVAKPCGGDACILGFVESKIEQKLIDYEIQEEARRRFQLKTLATWNPVRAMTVSSLMAVADTEDRIENLLNVDGVCLLIAQRKTGKTTLVSNLVRSLCDERPLFNIFETRYPGEGCIGLFDLEMTQPLLGEWLGRLSIKNQTRLKIYPARGFVSNTFSKLLSEPNEFAFWLQQQNISTLIIDPIGPLLASLGFDENSNSEIRRLFTLIREVSTQAGIGEVILSHHAGWGSATRARGASAFEDMVDVIWRLELDKDERYFSTLGRLGNIPPAKIVLDPVSGLLSLDDAVQSL